MNLFRGQRVTVKLPELKKGKKVVAPAETGSGYVQEPLAMDDQRKPKVAVQMDGNRGVWFVDPDCVEEFKPDVRTPLTRETLLDWAKKQVDEKKFDTIEEAYTNLLLSHGRVNLGGYDGSDLREELMNIFANGHKGYKELSISELMEEAEERFYGPDSSMDAYASDLEGLLEFLEMEGLEDEESEED